MPSPKSTAMETYAGVEIPDINKPWVEISPLATKVHAAKVWYERKTGKPAGSAAMGRILSILLFAERNNVRDLDAECDLRVGTSPSWSGRLPQDTETPPTEPMEGTSVEKILALNATGMPQAEIARSVGVSRQRVLRALQDNGAWEKGSATAVATAVAERIGGSNVKGRSGSYVFIYLKKGSA